ncbi:MAG: hypothetical protein QXY52_01035 [Conexivisphaerales archaeon]
MYDSRASFNFFDERHIKPVIRIRSNSVPKARGSQVRRRALMEQQMYSPKAWSNIHRFGWRVEAYFCASSASSGSTYLRSS